MRGRPREPGSRDPRALGVLAGSLGAGRLQGVRPCECGRLLEGGEWRGGLRNGRADKAALRAWPQVTGTACGSGVQGNDFQSLGKSADFPLSRAFARVRKKGILECRLLQAARAFALPAALSLHLANDHQMTPPLFAGAFRDCGPFAPLTAARLSGTASRALRPKASRRAGLRSEL